MRHALQISLLALTVAAGLAASPVAVHGSFASTVSVNMNAALGGYNAADTWSNNISGPGGLTIGGTGQLTLSGTDISAGPTTVNGGVLEVAGSITSATTVNSGGLLAGAGTVGMVTVNSGGTLDPGGITTAGHTLTVNGALTFAAGSTLAIGASPSASTKVKVNGLTTINGGSVVVTAGSGSYAPSTTYTLISATSGVSGAFVGVSSDLAFLSPYVG